ncbi:MAG: hypothetical protein ACRCTJ_03945 [Brevinema sp.]
MHYFNKELFQDEIYAIFKYQRETLLSNFSVNIGEFERFIIDMIFEITKGFSSDKLVELSHEPHVSWYLHYRPNIHQLTMMKV